MLIKPDILTCYEHTLLDVIPEMSELLTRIQFGDQSALNELVAALYGELHRIALRQLQMERPEHTLQATALIHEAYLKLAGNPVPFVDRAHFLAVASRAMRQVLVDYARARSTKKRGGPEQANPRAVEWTAYLEQDSKAGVNPAELLDLDNALTALAREDPVLAQLIEMRYFGGMTAEETAAALRQSVHVVRHDLRLAQAWLRHRLG